MGCYGEGARSGTLVDPCTCRRASITLCKGIPRARADPTQLKSSRLTALNIAMGSSGPSGSLTVKSSSYSLHSAGFPTPATADVDEEGRQPTAGPGLADAMMMEDGGERLRFEGGAEMMGGMTLMVPRVEKGGKLYAGKLHLGSIRGRC